MTIPPDPGPIPNYPSLEGVTFKFGKNLGVVIRVQDGASIAIGSDIPDGRQYDAWLAAGNTTLPADNPSVEEVAVTTAVTTRRATLAKIEAAFPTSWNNFEGFVDQAIVFKNTTNANWVANTSRDCCKLLLNLAMFCAAKLLVLIIERQDRR